MLVSVVQPDQHGVINTVVHDVSQQPDVAKVAEPIFIPSKTGGGDVMLLNVYPKTAPQDTATSDLVNHLRSDTLPQATSNSGVKVLVAGNTAIFIDFANVLSSKLPLFIGLVVLLSFLLLAVVFRSFVIPLTAAVMNLLSIGAAFGILVAVFEWGDGGNLDRPHRHQPDRSLPAGDAVRPPVRPVDGLPGVPGLTDARGVHQVRPGTTAPPYATGWPQRARPSRPPR